MADEITNQSVEESPQGEEQSTDWKAEARKWERLAKKGHAAELELEKLKQEQMSEQEKANARAEAAEAELNTLKAEQARQQAAHEIAAKTGVPLDLLLFCADEEAMTDFASKYTANARIAAAPSAAPSRVIRGGEQKPSARDQFVRLLEDAGF